MRCLLLLLVLPRITFPVVGRAVRERDMHWIRVDRYYTFNEENTKDYEEKKIRRNKGAMENVSVVHQPMMCQHCEHLAKLFVGFSNCTSTEGFKLHKHNRCRRYKILCK
jgi:molybdopterin-containing oxidoreductase family iron-sulfur binding subunit